MQKHLRDTFRDKETFIVTTVKYVKVKSTLPSSFMLLYEVCKALMKIWKAPLQSMYLIIIFGPWQITYLLSEVPVKNFYN